MPGGARSMKGEKQMIYKNITFKADPFSYNLEFDDRITLVGGDSGTGTEIPFQALLPFFIILGGQGDFSLIGCCKLFGDFCLKTYELSKRYLAA